MEACRKYTTIGMVYDFLVRMHQKTGQDYSFPATIAKLKTIPVALHCWQGDDVGGFDQKEKSLTGGIQTTGNYPGKARTPEELKKLQDEGNFSKLMVMQEELKTMPFGDVWEEYCKVCGKPVDGQWYPQIEKYEADVLSKRG